MTPQLPKAACLDFFLFSPFKFFSFCQHFIIHHIRSIYSGGVGFFAWPLEPFTLIGDGAPFFFLFPFPFLVDGSGVQGILPPSLTMYSFDCNVSQAKGGNVSVFPNTVHTLYQSNVSEESV